MVFIGIAISQHITCSFVTCLSLQALLSPSRIKAFFSFLQNPQLLAHSGGGLVIKLCPTLAIPWTVACQVPLSKGFSRQEYWSGLPFPSPEDLPTQGLNLGLLHCRQILY